MQNTYDVIVIGGGAIGCAIAWQVARSGRRVLLLERGQLGGEASSAAAGMLGAQLEVGAPGPLYHLCMESRSLYRGFADELFEETGIDVQYTDNGILRLPVSEQEANELKACMAWQIQSGGQAQWLSESEISELEPAVVAAHGGLLLPKDGNVCAPLLARALGAAAMKYADVVEGADVTNIVFRSSNVKVETPNAAYNAEQVVVAAGAWADKVLQPTGVQFGISPVKGQIFSFRPTEGAKLTRTVFRDHAYLVPKRDGTIVMGATEEHESGYNRHVTVSALSHLFSSLSLIAPALSKSKFERAWIGFRPKSKYLTPVIGSIPWNQRLIVAVGHFRNGILLTPVTAKIILSQLNQETPGDVWSAFVPNGSEKDSAIELEAQK